MSSKTLENAIKNGKTVQIGVEGANFMHLLIKKISDDSKFDNICLWDFKTESKEKNMGDWLRAMHMSQDKGITGIGIICDIDKWGGDSRSNRVQSVIDVYKKVLNTDVTENSIANAHDISYGFHVTPTHQNTGCLETSLLEHANSEHIECSDNFVTCVAATQELNENKTHKIKVRALMAAKNPDMLFSDTANSSLWRWDEGSLKEMLMFIENMNG